MDWQTRLATQTGRLLAVLILVCFAWALPQAMPLLAAPSQQEPTPTPAPGGDSFTTNNYYGITCGDAVTPCHVVIDNRLDITATELLPVYFPTPPVITGTVVVTNTPTTPLVALPVLSADALGALLSVIAIYVALWAWMRDAQRIVLGVLGCVIGLLVVISASPSYIIGWFVTAVGLGIAELLNSFINKRRRLRP